MIPSHPCKVCGSTWHTAMYHKPRKPIAVKKPNYTSVRKASVLVRNNKLECERCHSKQHYTSLCPYKPKKRINTGKVWARWHICKEAWYEINGMHHLCHYCGIAVGPETITLDHKIPRSRAPELRYDFDNLVPCCFVCNGLKGSVAHDDYVHECHV